MRIFDWLNLDTVSILKEQGPTAWNIAHHEHIDNLVEDKELISLDDNTYYHRQDIKKFINQQELA